MFHKEGFSFVLAALLTVCLVLAASSAIAQVFEYRPVRRPIAESVPDEILVKFKPGVDDGRIARINERLGALSAHITYSGAYRVKVPAAALDRLLKAYKEVPAVEYAEPNYIATAFMVPNDNHYSYQWHMDDDNTNNPEGASSNPYGGANGGGIRMEEAWDINIVKSGVVVAVVDTGVAYENYDGYIQAPDLADVDFVYPWDFVNNDAHPNDNHSHGTHVTGTIAQSTNNSYGVTGVASGVSIMPIKVLNGDGYGSYSDIADGITWATNNGADVINLSLGGRRGSKTLRDAVKYAYENGVTVIAAAGNDSSSRIGYPAAYDGYVVAVGATRYDETLAYYSNYGTSLDLVAPGGDVYADQNTDGYADGVLQNTFTPPDYYYLGSPPEPTVFGFWFFQGTSMAAPHVSGVAALLLAQDPSRTPDQVRDTLQATAEDKGSTGWDSIYGWGIVDAYVALNLGQNEPPTVSITTPADGSTFDPRELIVFVGSASDPEEGDLSASLVWNSSIDSQIGTGGSFSATLSDGNHTITASVTESGGKTGSDSVNITVGSPSEVTVTSISPNTMTAGATASVTITGTVFQNGADVVFENGAGPTPTASNVVVNDSNTIIYAMVTAKSGGPPRERVWDVRVTNPDGSSGVLVDGLTVVVSGASSTIAVTTLMQNAPNPFNPETWIPFKLSTGENVVIRIYDTAGRLVRTLDLGPKAPGSYLSKEKAAYWDGRNECGEKVTSGIHFYLMEAGSFRAMKKMIILK